MMNSSNTSNKNQKAKVQVVRCPEVRLPADMAGGRSRPRSSSPSPSPYPSSSSSSSTMPSTSHMAGHKRGRDRNSRGSDRIPVGFSSSKDIKDELRGYLGEIKDLAATSFSGRNLALHPLHLHLLHFHLSSIIPIVIILIAVFIIIIIIAMLSLYRFVFHYLLCNTI